MITAEQARKTARSIIYQRLRDQAKEVLKAYPGALEATYEIIKHDAERGHTTISTRSFPVNHITDGVVQARVLQKIVRKLLSLGYKIKNYPSGTNIIYWY
jgi:hypothetical protein